MIMRREWVAIAGAYPLQIATYIRDRVKMMRIAPKTALIMLNTRNAVILQVDVFFNETKPIMPVTMKRIPQNIPSPIEANCILLCEMYATGWRISL